MNREGSTQNVQPSQVIYVINIGQNGQGPNNPIQLPSQLQGVQIQLPSQLQPLQTFISTLPVQGQQLNGEVESEKPKEGDSEGSKDGKKSDMIFCYRKLRAAIADVMYMFGRFDSKHAMSQQKLIKSVKELTDFDISKNPGSPDLELSTRGKKAIDDIIKANYMEETEEGYYFTPKGKEAYEAKLKQWEKYTKKKPSSATKGFPTPKKTVHPDNRPNEEEKEAEEEKGEKGEKEEEEKKSSDSEGGSDNTDETCDNGSIINSLFICGLYRLMEKNKRKSNFTLEELSAEAQNIQKEFPQIGFVYNKGILEQNITYGHIEKNKYKYRLSERGIKEAKEVYSRYIDKEGEPLKKRQKLQQKALSFQQPPPKPKKPIYLDLLTPPASPPPKPMKTQAPPQPTPTITPKPKVSSPANKLISTKKQFLKLKLLITANLKMKLGNELERKLAGRNVTLDQRMFPFECCLFCNGMPNEYVINSILVVLVETKGRTLVEYNNIRGYLERVHSIGFHSVVVVGMTDKTKERCAEYNFKFKKVGSRGEIIDFITTQAKNISERIGKPFDAVPFGEIHF